jgi:release factor glutamine methyltransferase
MTLSELQQKYLSSKSGQIVPLDFFVLLTFVTKKEKTFLLTHPEYTLDTKEESLFRNLLTRRALHEPVASITGHKEFYGLDFIVTKDTLIPRPETEQIVELTIESVNNQQKTINKKQKIVIIDVGTGSGNIIIALALALKESGHAPHITYHASDVSAEALAVARENAKKHNVENKITFHQSNLLDPFKEKGFHPDTQLIITANLPYLSQSLYENSPPDVQYFEPKTALWSDQDGLNHYYRLLQEVKKKHLPLKKTVLFLEISPEQTLPLTKRILSLFPTAQTKIHQDLTQKDRVVEICLS